MLEDSIVRFRISRYKMYGSPASDQWIPPESTTIRAIPITFAAGIEPSVLSIRATRSEPNIGIADGVR